MKRSFLIECADPNANVNVAEVSSCEGVDLYKVSIKLGGKMTPPKIKISWEEDMVGILHVWHPLCNMAHAMHQWFAPTVSSSCFHFGAPVLSTVGDTDMNSLTVAVSDVETSTAIDFCVKDIDQQDKVGYSVSFFVNRTDALSEYEAFIRVDGRKIPFYEAIQSVYPWWSEMGYVIPDIPRAAEDALYSSWYNFHQAPQDDLLLKDLEIAAELGFKTVILDDGWQFDGPSLGDYSLCGEWLVSEEKFVDFKSFVKRVHGLGMKLMVWFAVPFIGVDSPYFEKFKGKFIKVDYGLMNEGTLDPRYPDVRTFIKDTYKRFLLEYDIDGFKFDFIDSFAGWGDIAEYDPEIMDCETVSAAVSRLMTEIVSELGQIKAELLYEYRQNYIGPAINRFGNMLRVGDCAYEAQANRIGIVDLRLLNYPVAIHSDMLFWSEKESLKLCSRQLLNILFAVPQISVILARSTAEQRELLKNYLVYWGENRDVLLHGVFRAFYPEQNYTVIQASRGVKTVTVHHGDIPFVYNGGKCDVFHNGNVDGMVVENRTDKDVTVGIYVNFAKESVGTVILPAESIMRVEVPQTGMISFI